MAEDEMKLPATVQSYFDVMRKLLPMESLGQVVCDDATAEMVAGTDGKRSVAMACNGRAEIAEVIARRREAFAKLVIIPDIRSIAADAVELSFLAEAQTAGDTDATYYDVVARYHLHGGSMIHLVEIWTMRPKKRKRKGRQGR